MTDIRFLNVALTYARARARYKQAVARWRENDNADNASAMHLAFADMEDAADVLERDGLAWDAQHAQGVAV